MASFILSEILIDKKINKSILIFVLKSSKEYLSTDCFLFFFQPAKRTKVYLNVLTLRNKMNFTLINLVYDSYCKCNTIMTETKLNHFCNYIHL